MNNDASGSVTFSKGTETYITKPDREVRHLISDDELSELCGMKKDHAVEIFWGTLGVVLGTFLSFLDVWKKVKLSQVITPRELFDAAFFAVAVALCVYCAFLWWNRSRRSLSLEQQIRKRPQDAVSP